ncbi:MAG: TIGR02757 family protein [Deltaproteobacteria bacterium]|nr:TIGR02757 family protein [Deltaproteobacteria bacterium]
MAPTQNKKVWLESIYQKYHKPKFIHPDPLEFVYRYSRVQDQEVAGLIASTLAYGRVKQILKSTSWVLEKLDPTPSDFLKQEAPKAIRHLTQGFKHRFTKDEDLCHLLLGIQKNLNHYGSLYECFLAGYSKRDATTLPALSSFVEKLTTVIPSSARDLTFPLLPKPDKNSASKRLHMFLRWMVRKDAIDPGSWDQISPSKLIVPIDTHMHQVGLKLGFTKRKQANLKTALEVTAAFAKFSPEDPVKYDFSLTRVGILKNY